MNISDYVFGDIVVLVYNDGYEKQVKIAQVDVVCDTKIKFIDSNSSDTIFYDDARYIWVSNIGSEQFIFREHDITATNVTTLIQEMQSI